MIRSFRENSPTHERSIASSKANRGALEPESDQELLVEVLEETHAESATGESAETGTQSAAGRYTTPGGVGRTRVL